MPAPTPVAELFIACRELPCTIGGVAFAIMTGGFTLPFTADDMTNSLYYGFHSDIVGDKSASFDLGVAPLRGGSGTGLKNGLKYEVLINCATLPAVGVDGQRPDPTPIVSGCPAFAGVVRLQVDAGGILNVKEGVKYKLSGMSQEQFSYLL